MDALEVSTDVDYNLLAEVYASNIQIPQLKRVIPRYEWNKERFEEEKAYFLWWLKETAERKGYRFLDQVSAWEAFERIHQINEIDEDGEFTPSWMEEINQIVNQMVKPGNYNEYMGQS